MEISRHIDKKLDDSNLQFFLVPANRQEYVDLYVKYIFEDSIDVQYSQFAW